MDVVVWLRSLGLGKYEAAFRDNQINETVLPSLTSSDVGPMTAAVATTAAEPMRKKRRLIIGRDK